MINGGGVNLKMCRICLERERGRERKVWMLEYERLKRVNIVLGSGVVRCMVIIWV